jgi:hypothetical protein
MASGYQQDSNQLTPGYYRVVWTASTATYPTADGNTNGALNPYNWDTYAVKPTSQANSNRVTRGNIRWAHVLENLSLLSDCRIENVVVTSSGNTAADNQPTGVAFTVVYDRDSFVLPGLQKLNTTSYDGSTATSTYTTTAQAIRELVTRGFIFGGSSGETRSARVWNLQNVEDQQLTFTVAQPDTPAKIWADIGVTQISGTTL